MLDESAIFRGNVEQKAQRRAQREAATLQLEPRYRYMNEMDDSELQYWMSVFGEVKLHIEPDSEKAF